MDNISVITEDFVKVSVSISSSQAYNVERSFPKTLTIADLKGKLELMTGGSAATMQLQVLDKAGNQVCALDPDSALLGSFPVDSGMTIHVVDRFATRSEFDAAGSDVPKFELPDEQYAQRTDTVRAHLERNRLGRFDPEREEQLKKEREALELLEQQLAAKLSVGDRCEVATPSQPTRRGTIRYIGTLESKAVVAGKRVLQG
ncbi:hypothetical protein B566_EDAN017802 [Ephemera danica]|nr:hypothetical protein B566_EDAN017802 [Ephemera danica]